MKNDTKKNLALFVFDLFVAAVFGGYAAHAHFDHNDSGAIIALICGIAWLMACCGRALRASKLMSRDRLVIFLTWRCPRCLNTGEIDTWPFYVRNAKTYELQAAMTAQHRAVAPRCDACHLEYGKREERVPQITQ